MKERWKLIEDYPNYEVSDMGRVRNMKTGKVLRPCKANTGYLMVNLYEDEKHKFASVHRLVATHFILNPGNKPCVNHIDGYKTNNCVNNLEWVTYSENNLHAYNNRLNGGRPKQKVHCIETQQEFESIIDAGRYFGCGQSSIWQSVYKGYTVLKKYHFELVE